jgi:hypothetical protein
MIATLCINIDDENFAFEDDVIIVKFLLFV